MQETRRPLSEFLRIRGSGRTALQNHLRRARPDRETVAVPAVPPAVALGRSDPEFPATDPIADELGPLAGGEGARLRLQARQSDDGLLRGATGAAAFGFERSRALNVEAGSEKKLKRDRLVGAVADGRSYLAAGPCRCAVGIETGQGGIALSKSSSRCLRSRPPP